MGTSGIKIEKEHQQYAAKVLGQLHFPGRSSQDVIAQEIATSEFRGWCHALDSVLSSLKGYPHGGGDINIMREVERIIAQAKEGSTPLEN